MKNTLLLCFYVLAGVVIGAMLGDFCSQVPMLRWLAYSHTIGVNPGAPIVLDLSIIKITFGFSMGLSVAQVFTVGLSLFFYSRSPLR